MRIERDEGGGFVEVTVPSRLRSRTDIVRQFDAAAWDDLVARHGLEGVRLALNRYADDQAKTQNAVGASLTLRPLVPVIVTLGVVALFAVVSCFAGMQSDGTETAEGPDEEIVAWLTSPANGMTQKYEADAFKVATRFRIADAIPKAAIWAASFPNEANGDPQVDESQPEVRAAFEFLAIWEPADIESAVLNGPEWMGDDARRAEIIRCLGEVLVR